MHKRLEIARAARIAGVRREEIQNHIQAGRLTAFEGTVDLAELTSVYPGLAHVGDEMLDRVARIKEEALSKAVGGPPRNTEALLEALRNSEAESRHYREKIGAYRQLLQDVLAMLREHARTLGGSPRLQAIADWMERKMRSLG